jgi:flavin-dependent dehydrogenase
MKIGIVGARVAGSYAGLLLSQLGHEVLLFDHAAGHEKPCGGGVTFKAIQKMPWFVESPLPHAKIGTIRLSTCEGYAGTLSIPHPIHIFSRQNLDSYLLQWARKTGIQFIPERAMKFAKEGKSWQIKTKAGAFEVDYLVGADGANSCVRAMLAGRHASADLSLALGFILPGAYRPGTVQIAFQESGFHGYIWSFPCVDHTSVGIVNWLPGTRASDLKHRLEEFISIQYPNVSADKRFYAATIPCLSRRSLIDQSVCGKDWALLGDAAGFADPITAEGIYYALRSAELLVESFRQGDPSRYEMLWRTDFMTNLESAAACRNLFYGGMVLNKAFIRRALQSIRYSNVVQALLDDLICGNISYKTLFRSLVFRSPQIVTQMLRNRLDDLRMTNYE